MKFTKSICEGRFQSIDIKTVTPDDLMNILKDDKVILIVRRFKKDKCEVKSIAMIKDEIFLYGAEHFMLMDHGPDGDRKEHVKADTLEDWRKEFDKEGSYIGIYDDGWDRLGESKDFLYETVLEKAIEVYVTNKTGDFCGPLEIDFIEAWLRVNEDYYI